MIHDNWGDASFVRLYGFKLQLSVVKPPREWMCDAAWSRSGQEAIGTWVSSIIDDKWGTSPSSLGDNRLHDKLAIAKARAIYES